MLNVSEHPRMAKAIAANPPKVLPKRDDAATVERERMEKWLAEHINRPEPHAEIVTLTPVLARLLLERNKDNRNIVRSNYERMKRDILSGMFQFNGEPIIVAASGELNDGQHRCAIISEIGKSIQTVIVFGAPRTSRMTLNQGAVRSAGNYLAMMGFASANNLATVGGLVWQYLTYNRMAAGSYEKPTKAQILDIVNHYRDISDSLKATFEKSKSGTFGSASMFAFAHWAFVRASTKEDADKFFELFFVGAQLDEDSPILYCRNRLPEMRGTINLNAKLEVLFKCWNAWRRGRVIGKKQAFRIVGGKLPVLES